MKLALLLTAFAALSPYAFAQTANAGNIIVGTNKATTPAKPPTKPTTPAPPPKTSTPPPVVSKPTIQSSNSNQNQNANSNANANGLYGGNNTATNTARGGTGGSASGTATAVGGTSSSDSAANGTNSVDASDRSSHNVNVKELFIPPVVPPTPPSTVAVGNVVKDTSACGPLQSIVQTPVDGTFYGIIKKSKTPLGFTDQLAPYVDENGQVQEYKRVPTDDGYILYGHQVTQYTAILGVSGARNIALGGGGSEGSWGQGGAGVSSANQRLVTTIQLRLCEVGRVKYEVPVQTPTVDWPSEFQIDTTPGTLTWNGSITAPIRQTPKHRRVKHHTTTCPTK